LFTEITAARTAAPKAGDDLVKGKRLRFDDETWLALDTLARDTDRSFEELAGEAFADLLKKHGRPTTLKEALRESARREPANDAQPPGGAPSANASVGTRKRAPRKGD
jgi:predicted transcriptional regulator